MLRMLLAGRWDDDRPGGAAGAGFGNRRPPGLETTRSAAAISFIPLIGEAEDFAAMTAGQAMESIFLLTSAFLRRETIEGLFDLVRGF